jgi:molybdopterin/thiamine biosynthesis adenylyltransferase
VGSRWKFRYEGCSHGRAPVEFDRQVRAFGALSTMDIARLRFGIVGGGGTGSAVASLLPRIGARNMVFIDSDRVQNTNLNRLHLAKGKDANLRRLKVDVLGEAVAEFGLPISIARLPYPVDDARCRDALRACDVIFGCTDDHFGRNLLNRIAHFYLIPIIDLGLLIVPHKDARGYETFALAKRPRSRPSGCPNRRSPILPRRRPPRR